MRWYIIRTLLYKEWLRHLADRGGIFLAILMVVATLLLSVFRKADSKSVGFSAGVKGCYLVWYKGPRDVYQDYFQWILHLENHQPPDLRFISRPQDWLARDETGDFVYEQSMAAIEVEPVPNSNGKPLRYQVRFRYPGQDPALLGALAAWFWEETFGYFQETPLEIETAEDQTIFPPGASVIQIRPSGTGNGGQPMHKLLFARQGKNGAVAINGNGSGPVRVDPFVSVGAQLQLESTQAIFEVKQNLPGGFRPDEQPFLRTLSWWTASALLPSGSRRNPP